MSGPDLGLLPKAAIQRPARPVMKALVRGPPVGRPCGPPSGSEKGAARSNLRHSRPSLLTPQQRLHFGWVERLRETADQGAVLGGVRDYSDRGPPGEL